MLAVVVAVVMAIATGRAEPRLSVHVSLIGAHTVELTIQNDGSGPLDSEVSSAFKLLPVGASEGGIPSRTLWGPLHPTTGRPYDRAVRVGVGVVKPPPDPQPRLLLKPGESCKTTVDLDALKWAVSTSSIWPEESLAAAAEPGEYLLWHELDTGEQSVRSNRITLAVERRQ